ncbi:MAG: hypothetical protein E7411_00680 [Ruminococcaceae bacterium]|nr:hypothetical protein [Oscillospiraceae bacterium]
MKELIIECAKKYDADVVTFTSADEIPKDNKVFEIFPGTKTVIGLGFRVLRGIFRGVEEGTTYYQYTTMGVENLEETVMPYAMLRISQIIEAGGFLAIPQRRNQLIMSEEAKTNPEVDYTDIFRGVTAENQLDFPKMAVLCGIGEEGVGGRILNKEYGPFIRYCFILTDAEIEPTKKETYNLCDNCMECVKGCPGNAIDKDGNVDSWRCAVYYNGANGSKNPFMPPDAYIDFPDRLDIIWGTAEIDIEKAKEIMDNTYFYPPAKHFYRTSICGRACDRACYIHLEEKGILTKKFKKKFRESEDWQLDTKQFETLKREKEWEFTKQE